MDVNQLTEVRPERFESLTEHGWKTTEKSNVGKNNLRMALKAKEETKVLKTHDLRQELPSKNNRTLIKHGKLNIH